MSELKAPFPYFGGKSKIAAEIWRRLGDPMRYIEPFAGSLATLLARPAASIQRVEIVNDADGLLSNFWRALKAAPEVVAYYADDPVIEADLHARHAWLTSRRDSLTERLMGDPDYYEGRAAGWWAWGIGQKIGGGWCSGDGSWRAADGVLIKSDRPGIARAKPHLSGGSGVHRLTLRTAGRLADYLRELAERLRHVRVCCGDWSRVLTPAVLAKGSVGILLDPPYSEPRARCYGIDSMSIAHQVYDWARAAGEDRRLRIALCSYGGNPLPPGWTRHHWKTQGGYANQGKKSSRGKENAGREVVDFSPGCLIA